MRGTRWSSSPRSRAWSLCSWTILKVPRCTDDDPDAGCQTWDDEEVLGVAEG
jgi:hypothetical protein